MDGNDEEPHVPETLPEDAADVLAALDEAELRAAITYAQARLRHVHLDTTERIEAESDDDDIVRVVDRDGFTEVIKREPETGRPILYHVHEELRRDGTTELHWTYLGPVSDDAV